MYIKFNAAAMFFKMAAKTWVVMVLFPPKGDHLKPWPRKHILWHWSESQQNKIDIFITFEEVICIAVTMFFKMAAKMEVMMVSFPWNWHWNLWPSKSILWHQNHETHPLRYKVCMFYTPGSHVFKMAAEMEVMMVPFPRKWHHWNPRHSKPILKH